jgi:hypothetical protein
MSKKLSSHTLSDLTVLSMKIFFRYLHSQSVGKYFTDGLMDGKGRKKTLIGNF